MNKIKETYLNEQQNPKNMLSSFIQHNAFQYFYSKISQGGFLLFSSAVIAFCWSNFDPAGYTHFWHQMLSFDFAGFKLSYSLQHWINDALMTIFFFTVGLEIKRELLVGGLSDRKTAALPVIAAIGGMLVPALIYYMFAKGTAGEMGWGIPMATDIAFSLAILSLVGSKVPFAVRLFLTAFAIADDLGAILVIAVFYTPSINVDYLLIALLFTFVLWLLNKMWIRQSFPYLIVGILLWFALAKSGLHATISGVIVAMFIPSVGRFNTGMFFTMVSDHLDKIKCEGGDCGYTIMVDRAHQESVQAISLACHEVVTPLQRMEHAMSSWVAYLILPLFAMANAGVILQGLDLSSAFMHPVTVGVALGLSLGKPLGVVLFTLMAVKIFRISLFEGMNWTHVAGVGFLGGIGFTMSLFIAALSFQGPALQEYAKIGIIAGSAISGIIGYILLKRA